MRCRAEPSRPSSHPAPRPRPQSRRRPASARVAGLGVTRVRGAQLDALVAAPPPLPRTKWTRHVPHPVLIGHAGAQLDALVAGLGARLGLGSVGVLVLCAVTPPPPPPPLSFPLHIPLPDQERTAPWQVSGGLHRLPFRNEVGPRPRGRRRPAGEARRAARGAVCAHVPRGAVCAHVPGCPAVTARAAGPGGAARRRHAVGSRARGLGGGGAAGRRRGRRGGGARALGCSGRRGAVRTAGPGPPRCGGGGERDVSN